MNRPLFLLGLAAIFAANAAYAQTDDDRARARELFGEGVSRYDAGDYQHALESFQEAYRLAPHPVVRVNMANCYEHLGRPLEALHHFEQYLAEAENLGRPQRREIEAAIRRLSQLVGNARLTVAPDGALVTIDGSETRRAPITEPVRLTTGAHSVEVRLDGYATQRRDVQVAGGQTTRVDIRLERAPVVAAVEPTPEPTEPEPTEPVAPALTEPVAAVPPVVEPPPPSSGGFELRLTTPVIVAGAATGAFVVAAVVSGLVAVSANGDFEAAVVRANDPSLEPSQRELSRQQGLSAASTASTAAVLTDVFTVTAIVAAGATVFFVVLGGMDSPPADQPQVAVLPAFGPNGGGLQLVGSF